MGSIGGLKAAAWTAEEKVNVQTVTDFCADWPGHDINRIMSFFTENAYTGCRRDRNRRRGREAVTDKINSFLAQVVRFEVIETFAKGPMVFNEKVDHFNERTAAVMARVGAFFLRDGKIVEWYDYSIATERA